MDKSILKLAEQYVQSLYVADETQNLRYHNFSHTVFVVKRINEIAAHYELTEQETIALNIAGWFHDVGHLYTVPEDHEQKSKEIAELWLRQNNVAEETIVLITQLIESTKLFSKPETNLQSIIKDADTYNFGTKEFKKTDKLLKDEMRLRNFTTKLAVWKESTIEMMQKHEYYTEYCIKLLDATKRKNIQKLKLKIIDRNFDNTATSLSLSPEQNHTGKQAKKDSFLSKGIQTILRLTSENHMNLSSMADSKANILISVNAIIISLILSVLIRKIEVDTYLIVPTIIFLVTSLATTVLAIIATRPKVTKGKFSHEDVMNGKTNLLFFGNFYKTTLEEYKWGMSMMMKDANYLYGGLVDDIYYLGVVLGKKYKMLSIAYFIFMLGIMLSVIAFLVAIWLHKSIPTSASQLQNGSPF